MTPEVPYRDSQENYNSTDGETRIQCCRKHVVVFRPPREELLIDDLVKDEVHDVPATVVNTGSRRDVVCADEDEGPVDLADEIAAGLLPYEPSDRRQDKADPEEMQQGAIDLANGI